MAREFNFRNAVNAHRNRLSLAAKVPAEFFLSLDDVLEHRVVDCFSVDDESNHVWADIFKFRVNCNIEALCVFNVVFCRKECRIISSFYTAVKSELACNTVCRPKVRTVSIVQFNFNYAFVFWLCCIRFFIKFSLCICKFLFKGFVVIFFFKKSEKKFFVYFNLWHFVPRVSSIYSIEL